MKIHDEKGRTNRRPGPVTGSETDLLADFVGCLEGVEATNRETVQVGLPVDRK
jgi:hypothetical protein